MPLYFFDVCDGHHQMIDDTGLELTDALAARQVAVNSLSDIAQFETLECAERTVTADVRDEQGRRICRAKLTLLLESTAPESIDKKRS